MSDYTIDIPVDAAKGIAQRYGYDQVVIMARKVGPAGREHVTTYGDGKEHCAVAAHVGEFLRTKVMGWPCQPHELAASMLLRERERQISVEGWTPEHDDTHVDGAMAKAAACYAYYAAIPAVTREVDTYPFSSKTHPTDVVVVRRAWPWSWSFWKPSDPQRDLVRAGALIIAELERIARASKPLKSEIEKAE